jgi:GntR family transcriptional repressor for pyruvate dehydrogenase complex
MFTPIKSLSVIDEVSQQIKTLILDGIFKPGDLLPTEVELAQQLKVSRTVIREAKKSLIGMGLLETRGKRTYVGSDIFKTAIDLLGYGFWLEKGNLNELIEARRIIENEIAALAAVRATDDGVERLKFFLEEQKKAIKNSDKNNFTANDVEWHATLAEASKNRLLSKMVSILRNSLEVLIVMTLEEPMSDKEAYQAHLEVTNAIINHNPQEARQAMDDHIVHVHSIMLKILADKDMKTQIRKLKIPINLT